MIKASIIIPTLNRAIYLKKALLSLLKQNFNKKFYEIIIIDNGSGDGTRELAKKMKERNSVYNIRYFYDPEPGLLTGRHKGAQKAKGEILIFIDDDIEADKSWLKAIIETFKNPSVHLVGGRNLPKYEVKSPKWLFWFWRTNNYGEGCLELSLSDYGNEVKEIHPTYVFGLNFAIRKTTLFKLDGFHPDIYPKNLQHFQGDGETGLALKAYEKKYKAVYQPKALVYHYIPKERITYLYFEKRYFFQGICNSFTDIRKNYRPSSSYKIKLLRGPNFFQRIKYSLKKNPWLNWLNSTQDRKDSLRKWFHLFYQKGYNFHQKAVSKNPRLLKWVLKKNYWNYKLPKI